MNGPTREREPAALIAAGMRRAAWIVRRTARDLRRMRAETALGAAILQRDLQAGRLGVESEPVTEALCRRLSEQDVAELEQLIRSTEGAWEHYFGQAEPPLDRRLLLSVGMWLGSDRVAERTGLPRGEPPGEVHAMSRGPLAAAGALYEADMVVAAFIAAGGAINETRAGLDFGSSSGRVLRAVAAAYPSTRWYGCDPNAPAVEWAQANLPAAEFFVSGSVPPLALDDGALDFVYAISIWSHFEPRRGLEWFAEMRRLLAPGGRLVITTHGPMSVEHYARTGLRSLDQCRQIERALYRRGWWFADEFGEQGDWGVVDPSWGTAFLSPEWLLAQLCPVWRVLEYAPGRNQGDQDVYVLQPA